MSNWVDDDLDIANFPKIDLTAPPVSGLDKEVTAADMNAIRQGMLDLKGQHIGPQANNVSGAIIPPGAPCYYSAAGSIQRSKADAAATAEVDGLAVAQLAIGGTGKLRFSGKHTLTTAQWDAVTGQVGGLTPNAIYYLDPANAAKLTTAATSTAGKFLVRIGRAWSTTELRLLIQPPVGL